MLAGAATTVLGLLSNSTHGRAAEAFNGGWNAHVNAKHASWYPEESAPLAGHDPPVYPTQRLRQVDLAEHVYFRCKRGGQVALTFDDFPLAETSRDVLDVLAELDVPATFFASGYRLDPDCDARRSERTGATRPRRRSATRAAGF